MTASHLEDPRTIEACDARLKLLTKERGQADGDAVRVAFLSAEIDSTLDARSKITREALATVGA